MSELRTEEEQVEAIKNWWKENGRSTVIGVAVAVIAVFGWRGWQDHQRQTAENASVLYQSMVEKALVQPGQTLSDEDRKSAEYMANQLKSDYQSTGYAQYAALWLAKLQADQGQLDGAKAELQWLLEQKPETPIAQLAKLRIAQLLLAQGDAQAGLNQLGGAPEKGFEAAYFELKGDLLNALGREAEARQAYQSGQAADSGNARPLIAMKSGDLAGAGE
ncbi:YfgM family protein [Motiliproteus sp.]|uniref:YfgM family protein n=1 Tax=Motiliproteus sp. TaxID=1898955 RepID=UPI003BAB587D